MHPKPYLMNSITKDYKKKEKTYGLFILDKIWQNLIKI